MIDLVTTAVRNMLKITHIIPGLQAEGVQPGVLANEKSRFIRQQLPGLDGFFGPLSRRDIESGCECGN